MLPIYGFGALIILLVCLPVRDVPILVFIFGAAGTTVLEYMTGWLMESLLKMKYWDYSGKRFNIKGYICLRSSLFWGLLSLLLMYVIHKPIEKAVVTMSGSLTLIITAVISALFISDLVYAVRTALDVNKLLAKITEIRSELAKAKEELELKLESSERASAAAARIEALRADKAKLTERIGFFQERLYPCSPYRQISKVQ